MMIPSAAQIHTYTFAYINAFVLWLNIIAFAVFQGSDTGAGTWYFFARGPLAEKQRNALAGAVKPIWEANEIWSVFLVTGLFSAFPTVFYTLFVAFFYPLTLALIGLVFFGASFEFYQHAPEGSRSRVRWRRMFSCAAVAVPFLFGDIAGAVASGAVHYVHGKVTSSYWTTWITPFTLCVGLFAVGIALVLAATFQTVQSDKNGDAPLLLIFRRRAIVSGALMALAGLVAALLAIKYAPYLWSNLVGKALPFTIATVVTGILTAVTLLLALHRTARALVVGLTTLILGTWGIAQFPYFIPPDLTIQGAAAPQAAQIAVFVAGLVGIFLFLPPFYYLIYAFQGPKRYPLTTADEWAKRCPEIPFEWGYAFGTKKLEPAEEEKGEREKAKKAGKPPPPVPVRVARWAMPLAGVAAVSAVVGVVVPRLHRLRQRSGGEARSRRPVTE